MNTSRYRCRVIDQSNDNDIIDLTDNDIEVVEVPPPPDSVEDLLRRTYGSVRQARLAEWKARRLLDQVAKKLDDQNE